MSTKNKPSDLAVCGGPPAFERKLHVGRPNIGDRGRLLERINALLDARWLTNAGPLVQEFEAAIARRLGVRHFVATCNGTVALELAARALDFRGEVILPSFTFVATAHALQWQEITPVFCDIDPATHTIDPERVEELVTPRTTGLIGVHTWGRPCPVAALQDIADRRGLRVLYDAAHAMGCSHGGRMVGGFGDAEVFSFHATKVLNTFEGGGIATNSDDLAGQLRLMKNFGFAGYDNVIYLGTNGKMTEVCAAMGLTGLESLDDFITHNRRNYGLYRGLLGDLPGFRLMRYEEEERRNYQYVVFEIGESAPLTRDELLAVLWPENVLARRYFHPGCHRMEPYRALYPGARERLAETERVCARVLVFPTGTTVGEEDIRRIADVLRLALEHAGEVRKSIPHHA